MRVKALRGAAVAASGVGAAASPEASAPPSGKIETDADGDGDVDGLVRASGASSFRGVVTPPPEDEVSDSHRGDCNDDPAPAWVVQSHGGSGAMCCISVGPRRWRRIWQRQAEQVGGRDAVRNFFWPGFF